MEVGGLETIIPEGITIGLNQMKLIGGFKELRLLVQTATLLGSGGSLECIRCVFVMCNAGVAPL